MNGPLKNFQVEDAKIIFRNFSGRPDKYNAQGGKRTFGVVLDAQVAEEMYEAGWNVKLPDPEEEEDAGRDPFIKVEAKFEKRPPRVTMITSTGKTTLTEDTIGILDAVDFRTVDLIANASYWEVNGKGGVKAYLKTMFVTIEEDALERKYNIPEAESE